MDENSLKSFSGFAIIIDLRNFSEIGRRLLIQERKPHSNQVKWKIYSVIFDFLYDTLENILNGKNDALFYYKHTGDGFLLLTKHHRNKIPSSSASFLLLLDIYAALDRSIPELNVKIIDLLKENIKIVRGNRHLRYLRSLFKSESGRRWKRYIDFSIGAHCGTIFYRTYGSKKIFLGNTINQASRFQALSTTFSDYNLFFSAEISNRLNQSIKNPSLYNELSTNWFKSLDRIEIKGLGPTSVHTISKMHVNHVREKLSPLVGAGNGIRKNEISYSMI